MPTKEAKEMKARKKAPFNLLIVDPKPKEQVLNTMSTKLPLMVLKSSSELLLPQDRLTTLLP